MRSTFFRRLLDETAVEVKLPRHVLIDRLLTLQGGCSETDSAGDRLVFYCSKKGRFSVESYSGRRAQSAYHPYYVAGEVLTESDKTVVKVYTVHRRFSRIWLFLLGLFGAPFVALYGIFTIPSKAGIPIGIGVAVLFLILLFSVLLNKEKNGAEDSEKMKQEVLNRIEAAKRWEE